MYRIALDMLTGDRAKFFGIVFGLSFATLLMTQQMSIFVGLMSRSFWFLDDTRQGDVWVMDPEVEYIDQVEPMRETALQIVRSTEGAEWAVPLYVGQVRARMSSGDYETVFLIGVDDASLLGGPPEMISGRVEDLRLQDAIVVDRVAAESKLRQPRAWLSDGRPDLAAGTRPAQPGDRIEINDHRALIVGVCRSTRSILAQPVAYTTFTRARAFVPPRRTELSLVLAKARPGVDAKVLAERIQQRTGLKARTQGEFSWDTVQYYLRNTGIAINFGMAVALGFLVGTVIAGQTFYNFTLDNLKTFGALKAMGASNGLLLRMVTLQALFAGFLGYGFGLGLTGAFGFLVQDSKVAFRMLWQVAAIAGLAILLISALAAMISMIKVIRLEPAVVFKG